MLRLQGRGSATTCDGTTRRDFMQVGALGAIGLSLPQYLAAKEHGEVDRSKDERSCIMIFNLGAPSQLDTFDMKPDAAAEIRGPFKPISTRSSDFQISEILPKHAEIADKFSLVRSCHHTGAAVHDAGWQMLQTGRLQQRATTCIQHFIEIELFRYIVVGHAALTRCIVCPGAYEKK